MARQRMRAAAAKVLDRDAKAISDGVYSIAVELRDQRGVRHVEFQFPRRIMAPLIYLSEMAAVMVMRKRGLDRRRADEVALYLMQGLQEVMVALVQGFDEEHFERWVEAAKMRAIV